MFEKEFLDFEAIANVDETTAYVSRSFKNGLYKVNLVDGGVEFVDIFPYESPNAGLLHAFAIYHNPKIYFIPRAGKYISVYDLERNIIESIQIPRAEQKNVLYNAGSQFVQAHIYNNVLWLIPASYMGVIKLDLENNSLKIIDSWIPEEGYLFRRAHIYDDNLLYIFSRDNNIVLKFDFHSEKGEVIKLGNYNGFMSAVKVGESIYLAPKTEKVLVEWRYKDNKIRECADFPQDFSAKTTVFSKIYAYRDKLYLVPNTANMSLEFSLKDGSINRSTLTEDKTPELWCISENSHYMFFKNLDPLNQYRFKISKETNEKSEYAFLIGQDSFEKRARRVIETHQNNETNIIETQKFRLQDFLVGI